MAKAISLKQFQDWVKKNEHHTWSHRDMIGWKSGSTQLIKYFHLGFDTRDMSIYYMKCRGMFKDGEFEIHIGDDDSNLKEEFRHFKELEGKDNTLLDLLDYKIKKLLEEREHERREA